MENPTIYTPNQFKGGLPGRSIGILKTALTFIAVCLMLLTLKEYEIVSDAEAQGRSGQFQSNVASANQVMDVNIVSINNKSLGLRDTVLPVNVELVSGLSLPSFMEEGKHFPQVPIAIRKANGGFVRLDTDKNMLRVKTTSY